MGEEERGEGGACDAEADYQNLERHAFGVAGMNLDRKVVKKMEVVEVV